MILNFQDVPVKILDPEVPVNHLIQMFHLFLYG
jgi:hypothetical protein